MSWIVDLVMLGLATATVSVTISQSKLFAPVRDKVSAGRPWLGELVSCPYCLGHWVAWCLCVYNNWFTGMVFPVLLWPGLLTWLAVVSVSALVSGLIGRLHGE